MERTHTSLWLIAAVLLLVLSGVAVYKAWPVLFPTAVVSADLDPGCDLRAGPCASKLPGGGSISLGIEPRTIPLVKPLEYLVKVEGIEADSVEIDFSGVDMNMGFNRPKLSRTADGEFSGSGVLPVCVREAMEWEARVMLHTEDGLIAAPYRFVTVKPGVSLQ